MSAKKVVTVPPQKNTALQSQLSKNFFLFSFLLLIILPSFIYWHSLNNKLTRWDDNVYVTINPDIKTLHADSIGYTFKKTFSSYVVGNYHPLTMLSFCLDYKHHQLNPFTYHSTSLMIHILNGLLVFIFIWLLTRQQLVAFITALLFAIHPMHVESVAWVSERKDVLYAFFYLGTLCIYILYLKKEKQNVLFYALSFFLFVLAVLSKAMAVSIPIAFFAIDFFRGRPLTKKTILEKLPFFIVSFVFGYIAIEAQKSVNAITEITSFNFFERLLFTSYGIVMYLWKMVVPLNLSSYYIYPYKVNGAFPPFVYVTPVLIALLLFMIYRSLKFGKDIVWGSLFFLITIALVLQILPVGGAIISDRYTYLPYIGLFFIVARFVNNLVENKHEKLSALKIPSLFIVSFFVIWFCYLSFERSKVWHDDFSLWNDAIENKDAASIAYKNRADAYVEKKRYNEAIADYEMALVKSNFTYKDGYFGKGYTYYVLNDYKKAIENFDQYLKLNNNYINAYVYRGLSYFGLKQYNKAIEDISKALQMDPRAASSFYTRGLSYYYLGKYQEALKDYDEAIKLDPKYADAYSNRGLTYFQFKDYNKAISDYDMAIQYHPQVANAYYNRALAYDQLKTYDNAIKDYTTTIQFMPEFPDAYYNRAMDYFAIKKFELALNDVLKSKQLGFAVNLNFMNMLQNKVNAKN
jgi:protein O-mannosyl-transferase